MIRQFIFENLYDLDQQYWVDKGYAWDFDRKAMFDKPEYNARFQRNFLKEVNNKDYYIFITSINQKATWDKTVKKYGLEGNIYYQSGWCYNVNHPAGSKEPGNDGPRLNLFILHFPEGYKA